MGSLVVNNDGDFQTEVVDCSLPVLVDFSASWCAPCRLLEPVIEEIASERAGKLKVVKVSVDDSPALATRFGVRSVPTLMLFHKGKPLDRLTGLVSKSKLVDRMDNQLSSVR